MGIVFRQTFKTTAVSFFGALLGALLNYVYIFVLSKDELGYMTNLTYQGVILHVLVTMGTGPLIATYVQRYPPQDIRRRVLMGFSLVVTLTVSALFTLFYYLFQATIIGKYQIKDREVIAQFYWLLPLLVLFYSLMSLMDHYLMAHSRVAVPALVKEVMVRLLNLLLLVFLFWGWMDFGAMIQSMVMVYLLAALVLFFFARQATRLRISFQLGAFSKSEYRDLIHFSWYHLLLGVSLYVVGYVDTLMLAALDQSGMESLAAYRNALFVVGIMTIPYRSITAAAYATLNQTYIEGDAEKLSRLFQRSSVNMLILALAMFLVIGFNLGNLIRVLKEGYEVIEPLVWILMLGRLFQMSTGLNAELISISRHYKFLFRISILLVVMIVALNRWWIPQYGVFGAAWSATLGFFVFNLLKMVYLWYKTGIQPYTLNSLKVLASGAVAAVAGYFLPYLGQPVVDTGVRSLILLLVFGAGLLITRPSEELTSLWKRWNPF